MENINPLSGLQFSTLANEKNFTSAFHTYVNAMQKSVSNFSSLRRDGICYLPTEPPTLPPIASRANSWTDTIPLTPKAKLPSSLEAERRYSAPGSTTLARSFLVAQQKYYEKQALRAADKTTLTSCSSSPSLPQESSGEESAFLCYWDNCGEALSTRTGLATHCSTHLTPYCSSLWKRPRTEPLYCRWKGCSEQFTTLKDLAKHLSLENHIGQTPFIPKEEMEDDTDVEKKRKKKFMCSVPGCGKTFTDSSNRKKHERTHDVNRERFYCTHPGCHKSYSTKTDLNIHFKVHKGEYPHKCTHANCGKAFVRLSELYAHERTHDNILPHVCAGCGKRFREKSRLRKHEESHACSADAFHQSLPEAFIPQTLPNTIPY